MSKIKNSALDEYGAWPFEQQQFGIAGIEGVKKHVLNYSYMQVNVLTSMTQTQCYVRSLDDNTDTARSNRLRQRLCYLLRQPLLH